VKEVMFHTLLQNVSTFVSGLCEVETGQSNIILDIEESRGTRKFDVIYRMKCPNYIVPVLKHYAVETFQCKLGSTLLNLRNR
jgi:hypothetical protein